MVHHAPPGEDGAPAAVAAAAALVAAAAAAADAAAADAAAADAAAAVEAAGSVDPAEGAAGAVATAGEVAAAGAAHLCALHTRAVAAGKGLAAAHAALGQREGMQARGARSWVEKAAEARHACQRLGWAACQEARPIPPPAVLAHLGWMSPCAALHCPHRPSALERDYINAAPLK